MQNIEKISQDLFNKLRGRFTDITIGDGNGTVTNDPEVARFFDFSYTEGTNKLGKVSVSLNEEGKLTIIYSKDFITAEDKMTQDNWYNFLKELRQFAKKRMLEFDVRDITKTNLTKRDYKFLADTGDETMKESKMYGTARLSYQNVDEARLVIKHTENVNQELAAGRTKKIGAIYIESAEGERFKYPYKHLSGARAMARHVAEGGKPYDDFGKHIVSLSEELAKLKKFNTYMGRSAVMAESLSEYMDVVKERISTVKKTVESLQKPNFYKQTFEAFETPVFEDVPDEVRENWIDELTIKQFNEELADVFPYIYKLVSEATKATELGPDDIVGEEKQKGVDGKACWDGYKRMGTKMKGGKRVDNCVPTGKGKTKEEIELESAFEEMMGQFAEGNMKDLLIQAMEKIVSDESGELLHKALSKGALGPDVQRYLEDMYNDVAIDYGLHPDDDHEDIEQRMWDQIEADYGVDEGNAYAHAVRKAKMDGKEKGDEIDGPDGKKIKLEQDDDKTPLGEFILSYYDREVGEFPKGETAVLTMVEKDYGEQFIEPAKAFIEQINQTFEEYQMRSQPQQLDTQEFDRMRELAGLR